MHQNDPSNVAQVIVGAGARTKESRIKMSSGVRELKLNSLPSSVQLSEKQDTPSEEEEEEECEKCRDEWTGPAASSPEPASDDDQMDSPRTVRAASPQGEPPASYREIDIKNDAPSMGRPLELSARQLFEQQAESREQFIEVDLRLANTGGHSEEESISVVQEQRQEPDQAPTIRSMYARSSPSNSFRYCYTERADGTSINYHSNELARNGRPIGASNQRLGANNCDIMRAFSEAQPKLSFASKRMKEYFESLKGRTSEGRPSPGSRHHRLYQFFKSTRTELIACLLFSVIVCQTLISCRLFQSSLSGSDTNNLLSQHLPNQQAHSVSNRASSPPQVAVQPQIEQQQQQQQPRFTENSNHKNSAQLHAHLIVALVAAFGAATLTQVFGHISGCHLLPAVSLALYFKGHITRARLASYLGAQSVGALAGVALLSLLTSSQTSSPLDHRQALSEAMAASLRRNIGATEQIIPATANRLMRHRREAATAGVDKVIRQARRRRQAAPSDAADSATANETAVAQADGLIPGSEAILLSIMEQRERELGARKWESKVGASGGTQEAASASAPAPTTMTFGARQQAGVLFNMISKSDTIAATEPPSELKPRKAGASENDKAPSASLKVVVVESASASASANGAVPSSPAPIESHGNARQFDNWTRTPELANNATVVARQLVMVPLLTSQNVSDHASSSPAATPASGQTTSLEIETPPTKSALFEEKQPSKRLRVRKRTRRQQLKLEHSSVEQANGAPDELASRSISSSHSNLLEFALPSAIMSSDSMRACIKQRYSQLISSRQKPDELVLASSDESAMRRVELLHCAGLSNGSQMFIFQLLATLLIVLTYLVNVDPRRVDVGFKSLSIGLAYFLAHLLTLTSGGFYGNPSELLALVWFSSPPASDVWRIEWLVYLIVPLLAALFGALSHDYIDFTSLRNRNKKLHLRRSFFSLESLADAEPTTNNENQLIAEKVLSSQQQLANSLANGWGARQSLNCSNTQTRPATINSAKGAPGHLSASVSIASSAHRSGSSSSSRTGGGGGGGGGSQTSIVMLNETLDDDPPLESTRAGGQRRASNQSSKQQSKGNHQQHAPSSSPKSSHGSRHTLGSDLLLDSNFLICCANSGHQQPERRLSSAQGSSAGSLGWQRAPNGRRKLPPPPPFCSLVGSNCNELSGAQFVCTSQFM